MIGHQNIITKTVHAAPTTKQAMNPFMRVPQPKVEASFTDCGQNQRRSLLDD